MRLVTQIPQSRYRGKALQVFACSWRPEEGLPVTAAWRRGGGRRACRTDSGFGVPGLWGRGRATRRAPLRPGLLDASCPALRPKSAHGMVCVLCLIAGSLPGGAWA